MKIIIPVVVFLILLSFAFAYQEGQELTQGMLDNINATSIGLGCQAEDVGEEHKMYYMHQWYWMRHISCLSIREVATEHYQIVRQHNIYFFRIDYYNQCKQQYSIEQCNEYFNGVLLSQHNTALENIRNQIIFYQTKEEPDMGGFNETFEV